MLTYIGLDSKDEHSAGDAICDLHLIKKLSSVLPISTLRPFASSRLLIFWMAGRIFDEQRL